MTDPNKMLRANKLASGTNTRTPAAIPVSSDHAQPKAIPDLSNGKDEELWSIRAVSQKTGLSRASIYRYVAKGLFPPHRRIGPGRTAWLASEVVYWMHSRPRPDPPL